MDGSDSTYAVWWKWTALLSYLVIFLNGTSHPVYHNDPVYMWLAIGSYTLVFLAGLWIWMGPKIRNACTQQNADAEHVQRDAQDTDDEEPLSSLFTGSSGANAVHAAYGSHRV